MITLSSPAVLVLFSGLTLAQSMGTQVPNSNTDAPSSFNQLDTDHDGSISPAEASANPRLSSEFLSLDANGNGVLEPAEFSRFEVPAVTRGTPGTPPAATGTPPPMTSTPPPMTSTPPPMGSSPQRR